MKTITKGAECTELRKWKILNANSPQNIHYDYLGAAQRDPMLNDMVREQGGICAYTMKRIQNISGVWQAHIEHILPRSSHPAAQSVNWGNMVACVPNPNQDACYGAKLKGAYDPATGPFVNPTRNVAGHFHFRENGEVQGLTPEGNETVTKVLHLNHPHLLNDRKGKIKGALDRKPTAAKARARAKQLRQRDIDGMFEPYCEALTQVLEAYATRLENKAQRMARGRRT
ncbi:MAG: hypothetical protein K2Q11_02580 [Burkholderiaceae bacterium]|nr:hypothetical protein [Burkholderiaceae bacterium]